VDDPFTLADLVIGGIAITLEVPLEPGQYMVGSLPAAPWPAIKEYGPIYGAMVHPIIALMCLSFFSGIHHPYGGFITLWISFETKILQQVLVKDIDN
jgi:hypothetical protein